MLEDCASNVRISHFLLVAAVLAPLALMANGGSVPQFYAATRPAIVSDSGKIAELTRAADASGGRGFRPPDYLRGLDFRTWYRLGDHPLLTRLFPDAEFYLRYSTVGDGGVISSEGFVYFDILAQGKFYSLADYNTLLGLFGHQLTDTSIVVFAEAFTLMALVERNSQPFLWMRRRGEEAMSRFGFPEVTFLEAKAEREWLPERREFADVSLRPELQGPDPVNGAMGHEVQTRRFLCDESRHQFAQLLVNERMAFQFLPSSPAGPTAILSPEIEIDTNPTLSDATVERESTPTGTRLHYYLRILEDGNATGKRVRFELHDFDVRHDSVNSVFVRLISADSSPSYHYVGPVRIDSLTQQGDTAWPPNPGQIQTGIYTVSAGYADSANPAGTYQRATPAVEKELTLEAVKRGGYAPPQHFEIHWCEQFFIGSPTSGARFATWAF